MQRANKSLKPAGRDRSLRTKISFLGCVGSTWPIHHPSSDHALHSFIQRTQSTVRIPYVAWSYMNWYWIGSRKKLNLDSFSALENSVTSLSELLLNFSWPYMGMLLSCTVSSLLFLWECHQLLLKSILCLWCPLFIFSNIILSAPARIEKGEEIFSDGFTINVTRYMYIVLPHVFQCSLYMSPIAIKSSNSSVGYIMTEEDLLSF